ncbi:MAG: flavin reductase [Spirochaetales bacterium]|nr:flavin reductase [Spirochaetales bacterium]
MKKEFDVKKPDCLKPEWPGKYELFSWLDYVFNIPYPVFIITTLKQNGKPNANLHSWGFFTGDDGNYYSVLSILKTYHTYQNIKNTSEWCINFPVLGQKESAFKTIENNKPENDEIIDSGFTIEKSKRIETPRIGECPLNLECQLEWDRELSKNNQWHVFCGKVVYFAIDENIILKDAGERVKKFNIMYNVRSPLNPVNGNAGKPETGILDIPGNSD